MVTSKRIGTPADRRDKRNESFRMNFLYESIPLALHCICNLNQQYFYLDLTMYVCMIVCMYACLYVCMYVGGRGRDVAQLVERRNGMALTLVRFPGAARDLFLPRIIFQCRLSYVCPYTRRVQSLVLTSVRTLKTL